MVAYSILDLIDIKGPLHYLVSTTLEKVNTDLVTAPADRFICQVCPLIPISCHPNSPSHSEPSISGLCTVIMRYNASLKDNNPLLSSLLISPSLNNLLFLSLYIRTGISTCHHCDFSLLIISAFSFHKRSTDSLFIQRREQINVNSVLLS